MKQPTKADLQRKIVELEAQIASRCTWASRELEDASTAKMGASAVILTITALGGRQIVKPVAIRDGLSPESIKALQVDLVRSFESATDLKPKVRS